MSKIIGIDLGTTNSCVAVMEGGESVVIPNAEGNRTTPSVVAFSKDGERMVGQVAKRQAITNPDRTIMSIKREMGTNYKVNIDGKAYTPQEISAMILQKLKADAEAYLGQTVTEAVITVPAYFTDAQRQATKDAGRIAGLDVKRIINEPTAAAVAYGVDKEQAQKVMVYDLGGGTFDVSILDIDDGVIEVLATAGNNRLGGDDFDKCVMDWMAAEFKKDTGIDLTGDKVAMQRLKEAAEKAKIELSGVTSTNINLPYITADATGPKHLDLTLTRAKFDQLTANLVEATSGPVKQAMSDAGLSSSDISKVLMVGGSSRIPAVQEMVKKLTGKEIQINIFEVKRPEVDAVIVGQNIARQLEGRVSFRRAVKTAVASTMRMGAEGIKIQVAGRVGGAEMARTETIKEGRIPLHTFRADIDYCLTEALTKVGILGVKVWICQGIVYGQRDLFEIAGASAQAPSGDRGERGDRRGGRGDRGDRRGGDRRGGRRGGDRRNNNQ